MTWHKWTHGKHLPWVTLGLTALCLGLYAVFDGTPDTLVYDRAEILNGQWWRLATGHLVHLDLQHLVYNVGALLALGTLYETASFGGSGKLAFGVLGFGGAVITAAVFEGSPATLYYCGLSAMLNALYAAVTIGMWRETGQKIWLAAFGLDIAKISWRLRSTQFSQARLPGHRTPGPMLPVLWRGALLPRGAPLSMALAGAGSRRALS